MGGSVPLTHVLFKGQLYTKSASFSIESSRMVPISTEGTRGKETLRNAAMRATDVRHDSPVHSELTSNFQ